MRKIRIELQRGVLKELDLEQGSALVRNERAVPSRSKPNSIRTISARCDQSKIIGGRVRAAAGSQSAA